MELTISSRVKALPGSNTWMHQYDVVGTITEIFTKDGKPFAKIVIPKWQLIRNFGNHILREWLEKGWSKTGEDFLLLDEGIELIHLKLNEMSMPAMPTIDEKVNLLLERAFGVEGKRLGIHTVYYPVGLVITSGICVCEGCNHSRTHLAWHNNWGTVQAFMVCEEHCKEFNGRCSDGFPLKEELLHKIA